MSKASVDQPTEADLQQKRNPDSGKMQNALERRVALRASTWGNSE
jgi:hypothetical protein